MKILQDAPCPRKRGRLMKNGDFVTKKIVDVTSSDELSIETLSQNKIVKTDIEDNANEVLILPDL